ncbi:MAG TPA: heat-inducible transcriptional repressor HrcA [Armatimonadota bacterium]|nr:heat-inducible transcriptional repressor HrcA [Armatimonadota bacterium]
MTDSELDARKQAILKAVCDEHIARAEPVGSELLAAHYALGVRSATLRNEMAEMTELGYLRQPHTSAGRIPSDRGYRYYVDRLMFPHALTSPERRAIKRLQDLLDQQVGEILREACRVIAELTRYTSLATPPVAHDSRLASVRLLALDTRRILVVLLLESGRVEHQVVEPRESFQRINMDLLQAAINAVLAGTECGQFPKVLDFSSHPARVRDLLERITAAIRERLRPKDPDELVLQGEANALREPEFQDLSRLDRLLELLHSRKAIYDVVSLAESEFPVTVVIGSESGYEQTREYSFIGARYSIAGSVAGTIGVVGPTRMRYSQAVPVVQTVARQITAVLTHLVAGLSPVRSDTD